MPPPVSAIRMGRVAGARPQRRRLGDDAAQALHVERGSVVVPVAEGAGRDHDGVGQNEAALGAGRQIYFRGWV